MDRFYTEFDNIMEKSYNTKKKKTVKEKMLAGEIFTPKDKELGMLRDKASDILRKFNATNDEELLKDLFKQDLQNVKINPPFFCDYGENIKFGKNVFINYNCVFLDCAEIIIGDNCDIAPNVQIYTVNHPINPIERNSGINIAKPVKIGARCWIGGGAIILPGVEIGEGSTIGAGSVVTKSIPPGCLAVGNPCKVVRKI